MIINNNIPALNTYRQLGINQNSMQKSMEKLSSGLRINKAGDDAAGLAISEKMRGQIRGLDQASRNASDGISLIQTAEGALNETHNILQRMRELSVQSANDTNVGVDREELQKEVDQLSQELSRIGNNTEFNTQKLLDGSFENKTFQIGANEGQNLSLSVDDMRGNALSLTGDITLSTTAAISSGSNNSGQITGGAADGNYTVSGTNLLNSDGDVVATATASGSVWTGNGAGALGDDVITFTENITKGTITIKDDVATADVTFDNTGLEAGKYTYDSANSQLIDSNGNVVGNDSAAGGTFVDNDGDALFTLKGGKPSDGTTFEVGGIDISSQESADAAVTTINNAIETVSAERSKMGAYQNRLEHTIANLDNSSENLSAAESRIRDVDMAKEMMEMTRANILSQASQSMLAQANQQPQSVLQLLG
jgi:flagellin